MCVIRHVLLCAVIHCVYVVHVALIGHSKAHKGGGER